MSQTPTNETASETPAVGSHHLYRGDGLDTYADWPTPATIISDGAYGVGGFHGDPRTPEGLGEWYRPHIEAWSSAASLATTLWLWNTEVGWANIHPVLIVNDEDASFRTLGIKVSRMWPATSTAVRSDDSP